LNDEEIFTFTTAPIDGPLFRNGVRLSKEKENVTADREGVLIRQAKTGNARAFEEIIFLYQQRIFKLAYWFLQDPEDAMEIVQDTFLRLYKNIHGFREGTRFQGWIFRIATNLCIDYYRKFKKRQQKGEDINRWAADRQALADSTDNPEEQASRQVLRENIKNSVRRLPKREKMIFVLKHYSQLKYREIAEIMNISTGTVKSAHHRALSRVKREVME